MANNTIVNATTTAGGDVIATEDVSGVKYELIKLYDATVTSVPGLTEFTSMYTEYASTGITAVKANLPEAGVNCGMIGIEIYTSTAAVGGKVPIHYLCCMGAGA